MTFITKKKTWSQVSQETGYSLSCVKKWGQRVKQGLILYPKTARPDHVNDARLETFRQRIAAQVKDDQAPGHKGLTRAYAKLGLVQRLMLAWHLRVCPNIRPELQNGESKEKLGSPNP